jgi:hypothetical protein
LFSEGRGGRCNGDKLLTWAIFQDGWGNETARDVHLRLASTQALDSFLPLVLRELSRPTEPHTTILGALAALASARRDQA